MLWAYPHDVSIALIFTQAVRKLMDVKKLESTLSYDSAFGDGKG